MPRYELTDAIDQGEPGRALLVLHRMLDGGGLAPVQVMATLHGHFANMLALDGDDVAQRARRGGRPGYGAVRGQEGARAVPPPGQRQDRRGHQPDRQGRPRRARGERPRRRSWSSRYWWPGWRARPGPRAFGAPARWRSPLSRASPPAVRARGRRTTSGGSRGPGRRTRASRSPGRWARGRCGRRPPRAGVVGVDVGHEDFEAAVGHRSAPGRGHLVLGRHRVQPDGGVAVAHLGVHDGAVVGPVEAARGESERADQEVVGRLDVLVDEHGDDGGLGGGVIGRGHGSTMCSGRARRLGQT